MHFFVGTDTTTWYFVDAERAVISASRVILIKRDGTWAATFPIADILDGLIINGPLADDHPASNLVNPKG